MARNYNNRTDYFVNNIDHFVLMDFSAAIEIDFYIVVSPHRNHVGYLALNIGWNFRNYQILLN